MKIKYIVFWWALSVTNLGFAVFAAHKGKMDYCVMSFGASIMSWTWAAGAK